MYQGRRGLEQSQASQCTHMPNECRAPPTILQLVVLTQDALRRTPRSKTVHHHVWCTPSVAPQLVPQPQAPTKALCRLLQAPLPTAPTVQHAIRPSPTCYTALTTHAHSTFMPRVCCIATFAEPRRSCRHAVAAACLHHTYTHPKPRTLTRAKRRTAGAPATCPSRPPCLSRPPMLPHPICTTAPFPPHPHISNCPPCSAPAPPLPRQPSHSRAAMSECTQLCPNSLHPQRHLPYWPCMLRSRRPPLLTASAPRPSHSLPDALRAPGSVPSPSQASRLLLTAWLPRPSCAQP